jgi:hypothetical protein
MKKIALILMALIVIFVIYYIKIGSKQLTGETRKEVNRELVQLKQSGFLIDEQNLSKDKQKIILTFQDMNKITNYFNKQGQHLNRNDINMLKGMQIGIDIEYMPTASDALGMDIYPIKLPTSFYQNINQKDKRVIKELEKMIKEKLFLIHININKLLSNFNGYVKDIDREFKDNETKAHLISKGFKFNGTIKDEKIEDVKQILERLSYQVDDQLDINISGLKVTIKNSDNRVYNNIEYGIKSFDIINKIEEPFTLRINNITGLSQDRLKENLLNSISKVKVSFMSFTQNGKKTILNTIIMDTRLNNINKKALEELENRSSKNMDKNSSMEQFIPLLKELFKDNISIDIPNISVAKITNNGKSFDGFKLKALVKAEKNFDWKSLDNNPLAVTNLINAKINIEASNELVTIISSDPRAMVMMMIMQPIDKNGKKYYDIEFSKGSLKINGKPFM